MSTAKKLTCAQRQQIEAAIARAKKTDKKELSAQDSIPYQRMYPDGICRVTDTHYTKTIQFQDINYQLAQNEDKTAIFDGWCDFLNYFDSSVQFQLTFVNLSTTEENVAQQINIPLRGDDFDNIRAEYTQMLLSIGRKWQKIKTLSVIGGSRIAAYLAAEMKKAGIESIPTVLAFRDGQIIGKSIGLVDKERFLALLKE